MLIFAQKKSDVDAMHEYLLLKGVEAVSIHGGKGDHYLLLQLNRPLGILITKYLVRDLSFHRPLSRRLDRCDRIIQDESGDSNGGNV